MKDMITAERIENKIFLIRGQKVMMDRDLAELYEVKTIALNQAVKRNRKRFPSDFMFRLSKKEKEELITNCDRFKSLKHSETLPYAFTEQGVAMLSSVLRSERAVMVNVAIMRAFVKLRHLLATHKDLAAKLVELERRVAKNELEVKAVFDAIRELMRPPKASENKIGFLR